MTKVHTSWYIPIVILLLTLSFLPIHGTQAQDSNGRFLVDETVYQQSLPPRMTLGQLYIAKILITNPFNVSAIVTARIDAPIGFFAVEPYLMEVLLPPRESKILEFQLTPHKEHVGRLEIHTILSIRLHGGVLEEQRLTGEIREIVRPNYLVTITLAVSIMIGAFTIGYSLIRQNRKRSVKAQQRS